MKKLLGILLVAMIGFGLTSCYRIPAEQGNPLKEMNLSAVRLGMSEGQVLAILGRPALETIYVSNRLVYVYSVATAHKPFYIKRFFVYFQNGRVVKTETR